jgi:hypothetical protein
VETLSSIAELIKVVVAKISALFDVFDVSFFVSGGATMLAFAYLRHIYDPVAHGALPYPHGGLGVAAAILGSYIFGLLCFASGRWIRRQTIGRFWQCDFEERLAQALRSHGLDEEGSVGLYLKRNAKARDIYPRLWAEVRQDNELKASFDLLRSYWVRAAVYDGLICVIVIWGLVVGLSLTKPSGLGAAPAAGGVILGCLAIGLAACSREAARSDEYQIDEIVATLAYARDRRARLAEEAGAKARKAEEAGDRATPPGGGA